TAEFLFDTDRKPWFLEVNARLQVEHGVTELGTGLDLVAEQFRIAAGAAESLAAFGDGAVYLEREIRPARHIEVQLLGDAAGTIVALGERDCSIQRRHQKLIEESPAPGLTETERSSLHEMAVRVARAAGLRGAATAEFLFDADRKPWFLEVNARLQVEHGVTELVTGLDLVAEQFRIAAGAPLSPAVLAAAARAGLPAVHAIEVRLSAEDPARDFAPAPGRIGRWTMPAGPGVRVDTAAEAGERVPPDYDPLIAKVLVVAGDRGAAIDRLRRALDEAAVSGIQTTLPFHRFVARHAGFAAGDLSIDWVGEHWDGEADRAGALGPALLAAGLAVRDRVLDGASDSRAAPSARAPGPDPAAGWLREGREVGVDRWPR
ncbi:MAG: hypothetical protein M3R57_09320, partial [Chloroflexota bacterium]|nr:hypothetical protein [Chloroflexota bacterium]